MTKQGISAIIVGLTILILLVWLDNIADHQVECREAEVTLLMAPSAISYHQATLKMIKSYKKWTEITNDHSMDVDWEGHKQYAFNKIQLNEINLAYAEEIVKDCS